jgi:hypothetical protein
MPKNIELNGRIRTRQWFVCTNNRWHGRMITIHWLYFWPTIPIVRKHVCNFPLRYFNWIDGNGPWICSREPFGFTKLPPSPPFSTVVRRAVVVSRVAPCPFHTRKTNVFFKLSFDSSNAVPWLGKSFFFPSSCKSLVLNLFLVFLFRFKRNVYISVLTNE